MNHMDKSDERNWRDADRLASHLPRRGRARWSPTARVQRGPSETARCTSTGDYQAPPPPLLREQGTGTRVIPSLFTVRVLRVRRAPGRSLLTPLRLISSRRIRRHEHYYFEALVCVILHTMLFPGWRHGPLPRTEHPFL